MKSKYLFSLAVIALMLAGFNSMAQRGRNFQQNGRGNGNANPCLMIEDLSQEQEERITELRTAHLEKRIQYRNQMDELRVRKRTAQTQANPDMDAINQIIDQMASLRAEMMKDAASHHQAIREILTDEQRVIFDSQVRGPQGNRAMRQGVRGRRF